MQIYHVVQWNVKLTGSLMLTFTSAEKLIIGGHGFIRGVAFGGSDYKKGGLWLDWLFKRGGLWWEWLYKGRLTLIRKGDL
jgi:hypothetical protein